MYLRVNLQVRLATQRKSLRKFNLRPLATTCRSVWPGLKPCCFTEFFSPEFRNLVFKFCCCRGMRHVFNRFHAPQSGKSVAIDHASLLSDCGRRGGLMVSALDSGASCLGSSPGRGHRVVFLGKTLYSHSASLHPGV